MTEPISSGASGDNSTGALKRRDTALNRQHDAAIKRIERQEAPSFEDIKYLGKNAGAVADSVQGGFKVRETDTHVIKVREPQNKDIVQQRIRQLIAGGAAGAVTKSAVAPLERVKILMQVQGMKQSTAEFKYTSIRQTINTVIKEEGVRGLYFGNGANVLRVVPVYGLKFVFNDTFKDLVRTPGEPLGFVQLISAGSLAGLFQTCVTYPLETVRTRLTLGPGMGVHYKGIVDVFRTTLKTEGVQGLYKGIGPTMLTGSPYVGLQMSFYEIFKRRVPEEGWMVQPATLLCGAAAGIIAQTITYPGDTVRRRMQTNGIKGEAKIYTDSIDCTRQIVKKEGVVGLFSGLRANLVRALPGAAIQFWAYDTMKSALDC